jgi:hypothetical protein
MVSHEEAIRLLGELDELGRQLPDEAQAEVDDALEDLGRPRLGRPLRTGVIPELEEALKHGADPSARQRIREALDNLHRQKQIMEKLKRG